MEVHGTSATGRPLYKVVINQLKTAKQKSAFTHWTTLRRAALTAERQELIRLWRDNQISDDVLREFEEELDYKESNL